jgi:4-amino-4-deoxy-L-arabinose transferase-like glycosyltransferase
MDFSRWTGRIVGAVVLIVVSAPLLVGLASFGIWDPWELGTADLARQLLNGELTRLDRPVLPIALIASGFSALGVREWTGRLPIALSGIATILIAYGIGARLAGRRAGIWAAIAAGTTPLLVFNARQMLGAAPSFATSAAVFLCAIAMVYEPGNARTPHQRRWIYTAAWLFGLLVSIALATLASGVLLGVAPPLLAVGVAILARNELRPPWIDRRRTVAAAIVLALALFFGLSAAHAVYADYAGFGYWIGGTPRGGTPPTWEVAIERVFHSFAPWSAVLPLALARMLRSPPRETRAVSAHNLGPIGGAPSIGRPDEMGLRLALFAWVGLGYLALTIFTARYGQSTFIPLAGAAVAVALFIRDVERTRHAWWGSAIIAFFFVGLLIRDFGEYSIGPIEGLPVEGIEVPPLDTFNPVKGWAAVLGGFALALSLGLAADPSPDAYPDLRKELAFVRSLWHRGLPWRVLSFVAWLRAGVPYRFVLEQARKGPGFIVWLSLLGLLLLAVSGVGIYVAIWQLVVGDSFSSPLPIQGATSLVTSILRSLALVPLLLPIVIALVRLALFGLAKAGSYRLVPALVLSLAVGAYAAFGFIPALSAHFSPRDVYDTYNQLASPGEPLGEFRVGGRAAAYYATGRVEELESQPELLTFLRQDRRVWVAFRADDLAAINREYRRQNERHLFVADARSARMILATNQPIDGMENQNYLAEAVLDRVPRPEHAVHVNFDNRVELIGYDLGLPNGTYVGPGQAFTITWYFQVRAPVPGNYQPFVHIDGPGERINGDHEPVNGRYPMRLWEPGDIIVDRQELRVPANYRAGALTIYMGFYAGEQRLPILDGPEDDVDRARCGVVYVR